MSQEEDDPQEPSTVKTLSTAGFVDILEASTERKIEAKIGLSYVRIDSTAAQHMVNDIRGGQVKEEHRGLLGDSV